MGQADVFKEAGFEVYHHAKGRADLNDWVINESCYVRAVHQLHGYTSHQKRLEDNDQFNFAVDPCVPLNLLYPGSVQEELQIKITPPIRI